MSRLSMLSAKKGCLPQRKVVTCRDKMATAESTHMQRKDAILKDKTFFTENGHHWHLKGVIHKIGYNKIIMSSTVKGCGPHIESKLCHCRRKCTVCTIQAVKTSNTTTVRTMLLNSNSRTSNKESARICTRLVFAV
jgi:hypothetical protein